MRLDIRDTCLLVGGAVAAVALRAPGPVPHRLRTIDAIVSELRVSGLAGADLATEASRLVAESFPHHSVWHMWETPARALRNGRGWSHQYNTVLCEVLRELGFQVRLVHAARVRGFRAPWFFSSHAWVKLTLDGRRRDVCASRPTNRVGHVPFIAVSDELDYRAVTRLAMALGLVPYVVGAVWWSWFTGQPVPAWLYGPRPSGA